MCKRMWTRERTRAAALLAVGFYLAASVLPVAHTLPGRAASSCPSGCGRSGAVRGEDPANLPSVSEPTSPRGSVHDPRTCVVCVVAATGGLATAEPSCGAPRGTEDPDPRAAPEEGGRPVPFGGSVSHFARGPPSA